MAEGVARTAWDRTATLWALMANTWGRKDGPVYTPQMIHPYYPDTLPGAQSNSISLTADNLDTWAQAVVANHAKRK